VSAINESDNLLSAVAFITSSNDPASLIDDPVFSFRRKKYRQIR